MTRTNSVLAFLSLAVIAGASSEVLAQANPPPAAGGQGLDCEGNLYQTNVQTDVTACRKPHLNYQSLINTSSTIHNIVVGSLGMGPDIINPAGLLLDADEALARLGATGPIKVIPTADAVVPPAATAWNVWLDGKYSWQDEDSPISDMDGSLVNLLAGADYKVTSNLVIGIMGTYENSDLKGSGALPPTQKTNGWGGGAYLGLNLNDNWVFSANVMATSIDTRANALPKLDSVRLQTSEAVTGYFYSGTWRFTPSLAFAWSKEWQEGIGLLNDQIIETAILTPGLQIGNTIAMGGNTTVEPWIGSQFDWAMRNRTVDKVLGTVFSDPHLDLRLQGGLNFAFGGNAQLGLSGEVAGLLRKDMKSYTGGVNLAWQF